MMQKINEKLHRHCFCFEHAYKIKSGAVRHRQIAILVLIDVHNARHADLLMLPHWWLII